tara:strand:- start:1029 stop:1847 length:819 start_codon:yes stop_codon:yes gene_type:complete
MPLSTIGTNQIADGAVAVADIADGSVTTAKIADNAVTTAKVNPSQTDITSLGTLTSITVGDGHTIGNQSVSDNLEIKSSSGENIVYNSENGAHIYYKDGVENFRINDDGEARFTDNIRLTASGKGIYLGVTSATASNLLDDYEVGTWTPTLLGSSSNPTVSYNQTSATYIKIGQSVHLHGRILATSVSGGSGTALIGGLPFATSGSYRNAGTIGYISNVSLGTGYTQFGLNPDAGTSTMRLVQSGSGIGANVISVGVIANNFDLTFSHSYRV